MGKRLSSQLSAAISSSTKSSPNTILLKAALWFVDGKAIAPPSARAPWLKVASSNAKINGTLRQTEKAKEIALNINKNKPLTELFNTLTLADDIG